MWWLQQVHARAIMAAGSCATYLGRLFLSARYSCWLTLRSMSPMRGMSLTASRMENSW